MTDADLAPLCIDARPLRIYTAFVAIEYDFQVIARSEEEALEVANSTWSYARANVAVAHAEVELLDEALDTPAEDAGD